MRAGRASSAGELPRPRERERSRRAAARVRVIGSARCYLAAERPDHPHPRCLRTSTSPALAGRDSRARRGSGCRGSPMRLKLFRAPAMAAAMAQVRAELGPDALILGTRRVAGGVEITAALEPDDPLASVAAGPARASPRCSSTPCRPRCTPPCRPARWPPRWPRPCRSTACRWPPPRRRCCCPVRRAPARR